MEKWKVNKGSIFEFNEDQWNVQILDENENSEIITVWGESKEECLSRANRICKVNEMNEMLETMHGRRYQSNFTDVLIEQIEALYNDLNKTK